jgi:hypothetical protein
VFNLSESEYAKEWGGQKRGFVVRMLTFLYRRLPKIGPLRPLAFEAPTPEAQRLFVAAFKKTADRYRAALMDLRQGRLQLANTDFDTGYPPTSGEYPLADKTYRKLLDRLEHDHNATVSAALRRDIAAFYGTTTPRTGAGNEVLAIRSRAK